MRLSYSVVSGFLVSLTLAACGGGSASKFNDDIVDLRNSLEAPIADAEARISQFAEVPQWDSIASISERMESTIQDRIADVEKIKTPDLPQAAEFKQESIRYFSFLKDVYAGYHKVGVQATDQARATEADKFMKLTQIRDKAFQSFVKAQQSFAKANDMRLEARK